MRRSLIDDKTFRLKRGGKGDRAILNIKGWGGEKRAKKEEPGVMDCRFLSFRHKNKKRGWGSFFEDANRGVRGSCERKKEQTAAFLDKKLS